MLRLSWRQPCDTEAGTARRKILLHKRNQAVVSYFAEPKIQIKASQAELSKVLATSVSLLALRASQDLATLLQAGKSSTSEGFAKMSGPEEGRV